MKFAPVLPAVLYPYLDKGTYHLVQAHHLEEADSGALFEFFDTRGRNREHTTILDNGVIETGAPNIKALFDTSYKTHPSVVVCPDAYQDKDETLELYSSYIGKCSQVAPKVMIVPQGVDLIEWCNCLLTMFENAVKRQIPVVVGVPKVVETYKGGRWAALAWMEHNLPVLPETHLLGMWYGLSEVLVVARDFKWVQGVDSTLPFALATRGITCEFDTKFTLREEDWNIDVSSDETKEVTWKASVNIAVMRKLLDLAAKSVRSFSSPSSTDMVHLQSGPRL